MAQPSQPAREAPVSRREPVLAGFLAHALLIDLLLIISQQQGWIGLTTDQTIALVAFITALALLVAGIVREHVTPYRPEV